MEQILGVLLLGLGGLSSAGFYAPVHRIRQWSWATYWITLGFIAWIILPTLGALFVCPDLLGTFRGSTGSSMAWAYIFGVLWGGGGLMAALALRWLGLGLGNSICLGICAIVGTLVPAMVQGKLESLILTGGGRCVSLGLFVCLIGIVLCGQAGMLKEKATREKSVLNDKTGESPAGEFAPMKGFLVALFGGIMSSFMAFSLTSGESIAQAAVAVGTPEVFRNIPILILSLAGGFTTNFVYAIIVSLRNKTLGDYTLANRRILITNFFWSALSGIIWYGQYFFYGMGTTRMGQYEFASWSIFMASIVLCANVIGLMLGEWSQTNRRTRGRLWSGIIALLLSIILIGLGSTAA